MKSQEVKSLGLLKFALHCAVFFGYLNLLAAVYATVVYPLISASGMSPLSEVLVALGNNLLLGVVLGFFFIGLLGGLLYNLFAAIFGGVKVDME